METPAPARVTQVGVEAGVDVSVSALLPDFSSRIMINNKVIR